MSETTDLKKNVEELIGKAGKAERSEEAMKFSQAALNAANAMCALNDAIRKSGGQ